MRFFILLLTTSCMAADLRLAASFLQKLRETGDYGYLDRASRIVAQAPADSYAACKLRVEVALFRHEFASVVQHAEPLTKQMPKDPEPWGLMADALMEMGDYDRAADALQKMVDLQPNLASLNRVAFYRFVTGDPDGAIEFMKKAISKGAAAPENLAWCLVDLGNMQYKTGKIADAEQSFRTALGIFPGYHAALAGLAKVRPEREAIELYKKAQAIIPMPNYAAALEQLYRRRGQITLANRQRQMIDLVDQLAKANGEKTNRNLALIFADENRNLDRALELAQAELAVRRDVYTHDALAWALYRKGRFAEARHEIRKALRYNTPEPTFREHARLIENAYLNAPSTEPAED